MLVCVVPHIAWQIITYDAGVMYESFKNRVLNGCCIWINNNESNTDLTFYRDDSEVLRLCIKEGKCTGVWETIDSGEFHGIVGHVEQYQWNIHHYVHNDISKQLGAPISCEYDIGKYLGH